MKKTIVHIIDNMSRGGAETMLVAVIKELSDYNNILVTLTDRNDFGSELQCDKKYCLHANSRWQLPFAAHRLKKIIKENNASIVHSHLYWSTIVARMGTPRAVPLVSTIHTFASASVEYGPWHMRCMERLTYKIRKSSIIAVAQTALDDYFNYINVLPHKAYKLYTFANQSFLTDTAPAVKKNEPSVFRIITVGNLKDAKNHAFLLEVFKQLKDKNIHLDIFGQGPLQQSLQQLIDEQQLPVTLKGQASGLDKIIREYDLYIMSSAYEGFSLSVLEAMAAGMPLLLSDIPSFKEQCGDAAIYFNLTNQSDFIDKLSVLMQDTERRETLGSSAKKRMLENFTIDKHVNSLQKIYTAAIALHPLPQPA